MKSIANTKIAREMYFSSKSENVKFLLNERFSWMNSFIKESYNSIEINDNVLKSEIEEIYNNLKNKSDINFKSIEKLNRFAELNHSDIKKLQSQITRGSKRFD